MSNDTIHEYAELAAQVIGDLDIIAPDANPNPWFCKDIYRKRDLQWAGYIGDFSKQTKALVFGINLEFTPAWRRIFPKIEANLSTFSEFLTRHKNFEWHWMGRPGMIAKDPGIRFMDEKKWTWQVDFSAWLTELENILNGNTKWSETIPMRPQMQIMRCVGLPGQLSDKNLIKQNILQTTLDLQPLVEFMK